MDLFAHPVTVAGLVSFVALGAWAMGRLQGSMVIPSDAAALSRARRLGGQAYSDEPAAAATEAPSALPGAGPNPPGARNQLLSVLALADSLGDLHEEVTAFRRRERVFATLAPDLLPLRAVSDDAVDSFHKVGAPAQAGGPLSDCDKQRTSRAADGFVVTSFSPLVPANDRLNPRQRYRS